MPSRVVKLCGGDVELGNFVTGLDVPRSSGGIASRALLAEFDGVGGGSRTTALEPVTAFDARAGVSGTPWSTVSGPDARDWGRKFLPANGGCAYIDLDHLELCLPEVRSASDHVASWHAMVRLAQDARQAANRRLPPGQRIEAHANNSDGLSHSYGGHLNVLISRWTWRKIFDEQLHYLLHLASFLVSSMAYSGQGKVGSENGRPSVDYQLSQRADFLETVVGEQTTYRRPIVNTRDEPHAGDLARLHVISLDTTLCHVGSLLKIGTLQVLLAMIEAGERLPQRGILEDPVGAVVRWSHDPTLTRRERTVTGARLTIVEHQLVFHELAMTCAARLGLEEFVPDLTDVLDLWGDTLFKLQARDYDALSRRLDWVLKWLWLDRAVTRRPGLGWDAPRVKLLDHLYSSLDPESGLYWAAERSGLVDVVVDEDRIARFTMEPPRDTRAWTRSMLLRTAGRRVDHVDWDEIRLRDERDPWPETRTIRLTDPLAYTREWFDELLACSGNADAAVDWMSEPSSRPHYH